MVQLYEGEVEPWLMSDNCTDNVPVLLRRATFCATFNADARNFQQYSSFALSLMLAQSGLRLIPFPEAAFKLTQWTTSGYQCIMDKTPDRKLDTQVPLSPAPAGYLLPSAVPSQAEGLASRCRSPPIS